MVLTKRKSLHGCTLNNNRKSSAVHFTTYRSLPEFYQGRLFIETYKCTTSIKSSLIDSVECEEKSTYKISSRGQKGVQAVVKQTLKLNGQTQSINKMAFGGFVDAAINFEYSEKSTNDLETNRVDVNQFLDDLCARGKNKQGLDLEHSNQFRALVNQFESKKRDELVALFNKYNAQCKLAGMTVAQGIALANTEEAFNAALVLLDNNNFADHASISEYPILSNLAKHKQPTLSWLNNLRQYIQAKKADFPYLRKLHLIFSSMVKTYCSNNQCDEAQLVSDFFFINFLFKSNEKWSVGYTGLIKASLRLCKIYKLVKRTKIVYFSLNILFILNNMFF
jgi:hypothetical protein